LPKHIDGICPLLGDDGRCIIYADRPFGCRTHFCAAAGGPYARREVSDLIHRLEDIDRQLGGDGSRPLSAAVQDALVKL
jgi:Fe-S-cluster containining protein